LTATVAPRVRRGRVADAAPLAAFAERVFRATFGPSNTAADMDLHAAATFGETLQREELESADTTTLLAEVDETLAAFAQLREGAGRLGAARGLEILRFYVDAPWHGRGVAQVLMARVLDVAGERECDAVWLGVWERNARAIAFYEKYGFRVVGEQPFMLGLDRQRDLVMVRNASSGSRD
jgi:diamine N-acetyltransferase